MRKQHWKRWGLLGIGASLLILIAGCMGLFTPQQTALSTMQFVEVYTVQPRTVVGYHLGTTYDGDLVPDNPEGALGTPSTTEGEYFTLGLDGWVMLEFENPVAGQVQVWDVILGNEPVEKAQVIGYDEDLIPVFDTMTLSTKEAPKHAELFNATEGLINVPIETPIKYIKLIDQSPRKKRADGFDLTSVCVEYIRVGITVNPGVDPDKPLNPKSPGLTPVAILGTETFDVSEINPETVMFIPENCPGAYAVRWDYKYADSDQYEDLVLFFVTCEAFGQCKDSATTSSLTISPKGRPFAPTDVYVEGQTTDGEKVKGKGKVNT